MAETTKDPAQAIPVAGVLTDIYTVPGATTAIVSTVSICNQAGVATTYSFSIAVAGAADTSKQYLRVNAPLDAYEGRELTFGITLGAGTIIRALSGNGQVSFNVFRVER